MEHELRVGVIGVDPDRGWARESHVPAVQGLAGMRLVALASRRRERAEKAAAEFGVDRGYGDPRELIDDPSVDVVGVAASVPAHRELILTALSAGKHVVSEWPLGVDTAEAEEIAAAARAATASRTAIGVQARTSPAVTAAAGLVAGGGIGRPLSASVLSTTAGFGPLVPEGELYLEEPATGMHLASIQLIHTLDVASRVLGPLRDLAALLSVRFPELSVGSEHRPVRRTLPDHALVQALAGPDVPLSVDVAGGRPPERTPFRFEIVGEQHTLEVVGGAPRGFQSGALGLRIDGEPRAVADGDLAALPASAVNVASLYATLRDDVVAGTHAAPDFEHARRLAHLLDDVRSAGADGSRLPTGEWPDAERT